MLDCEMKIILALLRLKFMNKLLHYKRELYKYVKWVCEIKIILVLLKLKFMDKLLHNKNKLVRRIY